MLLLTEAWLDAEQAQESRIIYLNLILDRNSHVSSAKHSCVIHVETAAELQTLS